MLKKHTQLQRNLHFNTQKLHKHKTLYMQAHVRWCGETKQSMIKQTSSKHLTAFVSSCPFIAGDGGWP